MPTGPETGTVDITALVEKLKASWITWATRLVMTAGKAIPYFGAVFAWPIVSTLLEMFLGWAIELLADAFEMQGFFMNTAIRKASQARDYVESVDAKNALPPSVSDEEYERAEQKEMLAFRNFVMVTN